MNIPIVAGPRVSGDRRSPRRAGRDHQPHAGQPLLAERESRSIAASARRPVSTPASWFRIVGVVEDVRHVSLSRDPVTEMYRPIAQTAMPIFTLVVRTDGEPAALAPTARATVQAIDPEPADLRRANDGGPDCGIVRADARHDAAAARHGGAGGGARRASRSTDRSGTR